MKRGAMAETGRSLPPATTAWSLSRRGWTGQAVAVLFVPSGDLL